VRKQFVVYGKINFSSMGIAVVGLQLRWSQLGKYVGSSSFNIIEMFVFVLSGSITWKEWCWEMFRMLFSRKYSFIYDNNYR